MKRKKNDPLPLDLIRRQDVFVPRNIPMDPLASYTGPPTDPFDQPVQDADDL